MQNPRILIVRFIISRCSSIPPIDRSSARRGRNETRSPGRFIYPPSFENSQPKRSAIYQRSRTRRSVFEAAGPKNPVFFLSRSLQPVFIFDRVQRRTPVERFTTILVKIFRGGCFFYAMTRALKPPRPAERDDPEYNSDIPEMVPVACACRCPCSSARATLLTTPLFEDAISLEIDVSSVNRPTSTHATKIPRRQFRYSRGTSVELS